MSRSGRLFPAGSLLAAVLVTAWGCGSGRLAGGGETAETIADDDALSRTTQEGPVKATVRITPAAPRLGDRLILTLEVEAEPDVVVEMPAFGEALGRFSIVDFTPRRQTDPDGRTIASQRYTLQAPMSGKQRVPTLRIEFLDERPGQASPGDPDGYRELLTEEMIVDVASVLPEGAVADELRPVRGALKERSGAGRWAMVFGVVAVAAGLAAGILFWRRRSFARARITSYDKALRRLRALEQRGLPSPEVADDWYVELSDIVRRYLEDRFGVRAPELTSEEFLQEASRSAELTQPHRDLLSIFLESCDRVKFAAYHPEETESRLVLEEARQFLDETRIVVETEGELVEKPAA